MTSLESQRDVAGRTLSRSQESSGFATRKSRQFSEPLIFLSVEQES